MTDTIDLKPCPFCGGNNIEHYEMEMFIGCRDCHIIVKPWAWGPGLPKITDTWNRRASE